MNKAQIARDRALCILAETNIASVGVHRHRTDTGERLSGVDLHVLEQLARWGKCRLLSSDMPHALPTGERYRHWWQSTAPSSDAVDSTPAAMLRGAVDEGIARLTAERDAALAENARLREALGKLVGDVDALVNDSEGVAGLHLNGDVARWDELLAGGRFEEWLMSLEAARALVEPQR